MAGSGVVSMPMEVRVTPHSSLSSWDERGPEQTKAKADGEGLMEKKERKKWTKKSERSCQLPANEDRGADSERGGGKRRKHLDKKGRVQKITSENYKMFLPYRH